MDQSDLEKLGATELVKYYPLFMEHTFKITWYWMGYILSQMNPVHTFTHHFRKIHFNTKRSNGVNYES